MAKLRWLNLFCSSFSCCCNKFHGLFLLAIYRHRTLILLFVHGMKTAILHWVKIIIYRWHVCVCVFKMSYQSSSIRKWDSCFGTNSWRLISREKLLTNFDTQAKTEQWVDSCKDTANAARDRSAQAADQSAGFLQQTGEQMKSMAQGAIDGVKNTLGVGDHSTKKWKKHMSFLRIMT